MDSDDETPHELTWKSGPTLTVNHPDSLIKCCVTKPEEIKFFALYKDDCRRLYRPRRGLTEYENRQETKLDISERRIWCDVYILPISYKDRQRGFVKSPPVYTGEILGLRPNKLSTRDHVTIPEIKGVVENVHWGVFYRTNLSTGKHQIIENENTGVVCIKISETYPRSLIIDTYTQIQKFEHPFAA